MNHTKFHDIVAFIVWERRIMPEERRFALLKGKCEFLYLKKQVADVLQGWIQYELEIIYHKNTAFWTVIFIWELKISYW